ncbi:hypothetical protein TNCV_16201 [Trichonephila clavipes]|nr:hypothetical protein TNCV_16201 [Trichonephila clavipes]
MLRDILPPKQVQSVDFQLCCDCDPVKGRETVLASSFYSQYGVSTISGLPLHDGKGRYRPEKSMTDSQKDLSQLLAIYFVVFQCNPWLSHCPANDEKFSHMRRHATSYHHFCRVLYCGLQTLRAEFLMSASSYIGTTLVARNTKLTLVTKYYLFPVFNSP